MAALPVQQDIHADAEKVVGVQLGLSQKSFCSEQQFSLPSDKYHSQVEQRKIALKCSFTTNGLASKLLEL